MSNDPHNILGKRKNLSDVWGHVTTLYHLAHGLRFIEQALREDGHDACALLSMTSDRLMDIASDFDDYMPPKLNIPDDIDSVP